MASPGNQLPQLSPALVSPVSSPRSHSARLSGAAPRFVASLKKMFGMRQQHSSSDSNIPPTHNGSSRGVSAYASSRRSCETPSRQCDSFSEYAKARPAARVSTDQLHLSLAKVSKQQEPLPGPESPTTRAAEAAAQPLQPLQPLRLLSRLAVTSPPSSHDAETPPTSTRSQQAPSCFAGQQQAWCSSERRLHPAPASYEQPRVNASLPMHGAISAVLLDDSVDASLSVCLSGPHLTDTSDRLLSSPESTKLQRGGWGRGAASDSPVPAPGRAEHARQPISVMPHVAALSQLDERQLLQRQKLRAEEPGTLLVMGPAVPADQRRADWSMADYMISRMLFKGSRTSVYKATCLRSGTPVALKVYFLDRVPTNVIHQVIREIKINAALCHRSILTFCGAFQDSKRLVLVGEYAARGDLFNLKSRLDRPMAEEEVRELVLKPLLDALSYMHGKGFCHRDIKPENLLYTADWGLRLADFGVSINLAEERAVTRAGTADYMAPEVERCPLKINPNDNKHNQSLAYTTAVDVWSVGVLAYELLVGFPPVVGGSDGSGVPGFDCSTLSFPASVSLGARDFVSAALERHPEDRPTVRQLQCHAWLTSPDCHPAGDRSGLAAHANTGADTGLQQQAQQREQPSRASEGQQQAPAAASEPSKVLAVGRALPPGMRRAEWGMSDFVLSKRLYRGSRSAVYKATCLRSGMPVALKVYFLSRVPTNVIHQLNREVQIHSELQHRGVLMLYAAFQDSKRLVLVSEYAARGDLFNLQCALDRPMTEEELRDVVLEPLLDALSASATEPENLLYTSDWGLRVADFGVSINLLEERAVTRAGTTDYMAPEVVRCPLKAMPNDNKHDQALAYTTAADVWSVGVLAYELLVGFPPVVGDAAGGGVPGFDNSTLSFPANVSAGVRDLITATLARQPEDRPTVRQLQRHPWLAGGAAAAPSGAAAVGAAAAGAAAAGAAAAGAAAAGAAAEAAVEAVAEMAAEVAAEVTAGAAVGAAVAAEVAAGAAVGAAAEMAADGAAKVAAEAAAGEEAEGAAGAAAGAAMAARGTEA
ncbi:Aurora kinase B, partial [Tetrabaena socialis]